MALIHIEAEFAFRVCKEEFGLIKKKEKIELYSIDKKKHLLVPICQRHHDVECCQREHNMEETPAVSDRFLLVIPDFLAALASVVRFATWYRVITFIFFMKGIKIKQKRQR